MGEPIVDITWKIVPPVGTMKYKKRFENSMNRSTYPNMGNVSESIVEPIAWATKGTVFYGAAQGGSRELKKVVFTTGNGRFSRALALLNQILEEPVRVSWATQEAISIQVDTSAFPIRPKQGFSMEKSLTYATKVGISVYRAKVVFGAADFRVVGAKNLVDADAMVYWVLTILCAKNNIPVETAPVGFDMKMFKLAFDAVSKRKFPDDPARVQPPLPKIVKITI